MSRRVFGWFLLGLGACALPDDLATSSGQGPSAESRAALTAPMADAPLPAPTEAVGLDVLLRGIDGGSVDLDIVRRQVLAASARVDQARASLLPNLDASLDVIAVAKRTGQSFFKGDQSTLRWSIGLSFPLDLSGELAERVRAAQARYRAATAAEEATRREQRAAVVLAYFNALEAEALLIVNASTIKSLERELVDVRARREAGTVRESDVLTVDVAVNEARQRSFELETVRQEAVRALNLAAGFPIEHPTVLAAWNVAVAVAPDPVAELDLARTANPEVDVLVETLFALRSDRSAAERSTLPSVSVGPRATFDSTSQLDPNLNGNAFLSVSWNPDLNGRVEAAVKEIDATTGETESRIRALLRSLQERILAAHRRAVEAKAAAEVAGRSLGSARENLRVIEEQLRAGTATGREVLEAQVSVARTQATLGTSGYRIALAYFQMKFAAGEDPLATLERVTTR